MYNILLLGSGGREHSIAWALSKDVKVNKLYCAPGNAGTLSVAINVSLDIMNNDLIYDFVKEKKINLIVVGPEQPLENGIVDYFDDKDIKIFGPSKFAAQLESSKLFARYIMEEYNIPQPAFFECSNEEEILSLRNKLGFPMVLKADGLAAGKGVIICNNESELNLAIDEMIINKKFGTASSKISVEECLKGDELSVFAICDGENYKIINSAQDHKRIFDNDMGPNTGGMGAYAPTPLFDEKLKEKVEKTIIKPTLRAMSDKGHPFKGFLYVGLMMVDNEPYVIEFNVRLGDPEAQVLIPLIKSSFLEIILSSVNGNLDSLEIDLDDCYAVTVVLASNGYPSLYKKGMKIKGLERIKDEIVFHAGTKIENNNIIASGGRVINVIGINKNLKSAIDDAYSLIEKINFDNKYYRKDIGSKAFKYLKKEDQ
ncbi:MAG: phosphoribosylamine--glycine ligase [Candidatus Marinimicrobia bacterium]|nr:phosphoribosylamine--glycine ligase [Candidatus Neomarinimicrobiota bacterium]|tara:strand:+ start:99077 stop:100360 length:1284 start_codon:yes stop_codon:yes gene_type:complete